MTPRECWEKHKHLDYLFDDPGWMQREGDWMQTGGDWRIPVLYDCWQAVKQAATEES